MTILQIDRDAADEIIEVRFDNSHSIYASDIAAILASHREQATRELAEALERAGSALGMFVMLIGEHHPGSGARIDAMLDDAVIQEALGAANKARLALTKATTDAR